MSTSPADLILVGASLGHCLMAWFIKLRHPKARVLILEREDTIPGRRTWSFHATDLSENFEIISPLITRQWPGYQVCLPHVERGFQSTYCSIKPELLQHWMSQILGGELMFGVDVEDIQSESVRTADGQEFHAPCVLDGRNSSGWSAHAGYQKFVGLHVTLAEPHGLSVPLLMDARVPQTDGYRFFYVLPWAPSSLLIEDTRYSGNPHLDFDLYTTEIENYARERGWTITSINEREFGVLPIPLRADDFNHRAANATGMGGGFFHPVTGYSLPCAVELADRISRRPALDRESVLGEITAFRAERRANVSFLCRLNRMMFLASEPEERYRIFEHFYSLREDTIQRFYAGKLTATDSLRLLCGKPPVKIWPALRSFVAKGEAP